MDKNLKIWKNGRKFVTNDSGDEKGKRKKLH